MSRKAYIIDAVIAGWPGVEIGIEENDYNRIKWIKGGPIPEDEINAKVIELQAQYDAEAYKAKRKKEYPSLNDFAEAYTEKEIGGDSTKWDAYIVNYNKVRTENPK